MAKILLQDVVNLQNETSATNRINDNNSRLETAIDNTLSRDGSSPNAMLANLDMNSHRILNLPLAVSGSEPVTLAQMSETLPSQIFVQDDEPDTDNPEGSLWIDSNSANYDLYELTSGVWVDTTLDLKGATGATGAQGPQGDPGQDGTIAGDTGATDNRVLRADGTGGATLQSSGVTIDDSANITTAGYIQPATTRYADGGGISDDSGNEHIVFHKTGTAVNQVGITNAAASSAPTIAAEGGDTHIDLILSGKGGSSSAGGVKFSTQPFAPRFQLTDGATINWDLNAAPSAYVTLGGNRTLAAPTNMRAGATYVVVIFQDGTGSRTLAWNAAYKFPGGIDPVLSTAASAVDIVTFVTDGTSMYGCAQYNFS